MNYILQKDFPLLNGEEGKITLIPSGSVFEPVFHPYLSCTYKQEDGWPVSELTVKNNPDWFKPQEEKGNANTNQKAVSISDQLDLLYERGAIISKDEVFILGKSILSAAERAELRSTSLKISEIYFGVPTDMKPFFEKAEEIYQYLIKQ